MAILKISRPQWAQEEQQRTIIPRQQFVQGISKPPQDTVPAMLRPGEEVITPETVNAMGGRQELVNALNSKLTPKGISLSGGTGPVQGGQPENKFSEGTTGSIRTGFACGTMGIQRKAYAGGTFKPYEPSPAYVPGSLSMNPSNPGTQNQAPFDYSMQKLPNERKGYASGTLQLPKPATTTALSSSTDVKPQNTATQPTAAQFGPVIPVTDRKRTAPGVDRVQGIPEPKEVKSTTPVPITGTTSIPKTVTTTTQTVEPIKTAPTIEQPTIDPAISGKGLTVTPLTQSAYYKEPAQRMTETLQKQNAIANQQQAQNLAQQGTPQDSAAAHTATAQQTANQESTMAGAQAQIAESAANKIQSDLSNTMDLAYKTGDWGSVNKILASTGQQPVDFSNLEKDRQAGNLASASQNLFTLANQITGTDSGSIATKEALMNMGTKMLSTSMKTTLGAQYDPSILSSISTQVESDNLEDPAVQSFITHVIPTVQSWIQNDIGGQVFIQMLEDTGNSEGSNLAKKAASGDLNSITILTRLATFAAAKAKWLLKGSDESTKRINAFLDQYGVNFDYDTMDVANRTGDEATGSVADQIGDMLLGGTNAKTNSTYSTGV